MTNFYSKLRNISDSGASPISTMRFVIREVAASIVLLSSAISAASNIIANNKDSDLLNSRNTSTDYDQSCRSVSSGTIVNLRSDLSTAIDGEVLESDTWNYQGVWRTASDGMYHSVKTAESDDYRIKYVDGVLARVNHDAVMIASPDLLHEDYTPPQLQLYEHVMCDKSIDDVRVYSIGYKVKEVVAHRLSDTKDYKYFKREFVEQEGSVSGDDFDSYYLEDFLQAQNPMRLLKMSLHGVSDLLSIDNIFFDKKGEMVFLDLDGMSNIGFFSDVKDIVYDYYGELRDFVDSDAFNEAIKYKTSALEVLLGDVSDLRKFKDSCVAVQKFLGREAYEDKYYPEISDQDELGMAVELNYSPDERSFQWDHVNGLMRGNGLEGQYSFFTKEGLQKIKNRTKLERPKSIVARKLVEPFLDQERGHER